MSLTNSRCRSSVFSRDIRSQRAFESVLHEAVSSGKKKAAVWLLDHSVDINGRDYFGHLALHFAVDIGSGDMTALLGEYARWKA